jgi:hypothetical protein
MNVGSAPVPGWKGFIRRATWWRPGELPAEFDVDRPTAHDGIVWLEMAASPSEAGTLMAGLAELCPGLTVEMMGELLTPDARPEGKSFVGGRIKRHRRSASRQDG